MQQRVYRVLLLVMAVLLTVPLVSAELFPAFGLVQELGLNELPSFYQSSAVFVDFVLILILFVTLCRSLAGEDGPLKHFGTKPMTIMAVIMAIAFMMFEVTTGFTLMDLKYFAAIILLIWLWAIMYHLLKRVLGDGVGKTAGLLLVVVLFKIIKNSFPGFQSMFESMPWLYVDAVADLMLVILVLHFLANMGGRLAEGGGVGSWLKNNYSSKLSDSVVAKGIGDTFGLGAQGLSAVGQGVARGRSKISDWRQGWRDAGVSSKAQAISAQTAELWAANQEYTLRTGKNVSLLAEYWGKIIAVYERARKDGEYILNIYKNHQQAAESDNLKNAFSDYQKLVAQMNTALNYIATDAAAIIDATKKVMDETTKLLPTMDAKKSELKVKLDLITAAINGSSTPSKDDIKIRKAMQDVVSEYDVLKQEITDEERLLAEMLPALDEIARKVKVLEQTYSAGDAHQEMDRIKIRANLISEINASISKVQKIYDQIAKDISNEDRVIRWCKQAEDKIQQFASRPLITPPTP